MKLTFLALAAVGGAEEVDDDTCRFNAANVSCEMRQRSGAGRGYAGGTAEDQAARRYNDLRDMFVKFWAKNGFRGKKGGFDESKFWAYGCHCHLLEDEPISSVGGGAPADELDQHCKSYKNCIRCVKERHGDECNSDVSKYTWKWSSKQSALISVNMEGTCAADLFRCDKQFVESTFSSKDRFASNLHALMGSLDGGRAFDHNEPGNCPRKTGSGAVPHECCGGMSKPFKWINLNQFQCCPDGTVKSADEQCASGY